MESPAQDLDEDRVDAAIADILGKGAAAEEPVEMPSRPEFPDLPSQDSVKAETASKEAGLSAVLRQKWAELSGAA